MKEQSQIAQVPRTERTSFLAEGLVTMLARCTPSRRHRASSANTIAWQMPNTEAAECTVPEGAKTAWVEDQDASGSVCYYPVTISVTGNPVHGLPLEGLVLSRMRAASDKERDTVVDQRGGTADLAVVHLASLVIFILLYTSAMFLLTA